MSNHCAIHLVQTSPSSAESTMALNNGRTGCGKDRSSDVSIDNVVATSGGGREMFFLGTTLVTLEKGCETRLLRLGSVVSAEGAVK